MIAECVMDIGMFMFPYVCGPEPAKSKTAVSRSPSMVIST